MKTYLLTYIRSKTPPAQLKTVMPPDQSLQITVQADNKDDAITQGQNIINYQIKGGPAPGVPVDPSFIPAGTIPYSMGAGNSIFTLVSVKVLKRS